ncbi:hypothetical protein PPL_08505 [Heterostelium album PN500]|uniref:Uncharacterized protein n=1 Tax=Heterostelium pallidum (strain ATCC 26659 / Pp 5 / PN500) TaxID=670386 RepID=D3BID5_HETP5|nr:hypothetical protein PPL_08505 [Heterostelium album PN500]EFA79035.1 hypothetical protein PPL_08505 [Heterostelium album PN500]|eukprot:XP_020431158.1 hypothetical protein PPL_08505 [Heterostelium album PN500]
MEDIEFGGGWPESDTDSTDLPRIRFKNIFSELLIIPQSPTMNHHHCDMNNPIIEAIGSGVSIIEEHPLCQGSTGINALNSYTLVEATMNGNGFRCYYRPVTVSYHYTTTIIIIGQYYVMLVVKKILINHLISQDQLYQPPITVAISSIISNGQLVDKDIELTNI